MSHTSFIFQVLMVEIVTFYHVLSRTLFSTQQTNILHFFSLQSEQSHLWSFSISYSFRHAAEMWPECDKHRTLFRFTKRKKSSLIILCFELYTARSRNRTYIAHFFMVWDWKSSSLINLYLVLYSARTWILRQIFYPS